MAKTKLTVTSAYGTFTRTTARTYSHLVIAKGYMAERLEANRLAAISEATKTLAKYRSTVATGIDPDARPAGTVGGNWDRECTARYLAEGKYTGWIADTEAELARLIAMGPITDDRDHYCLNGTNGPPTWFVLGWNGRLDLARKLASSTEASRYRNVVILDVTTGLEVH